MDEATIAMQACIWCRIIIRITYSKNKDGSGIIPVIQCTAD